MCKLVLFLTFHHFDDIGSAPNCRVGTIWPNANTDYFEHECKTRHLFLTSLKQYYEVLMLKLLCVFKNIALRRVWKLQIYVMHRIVGTLTGDFGKGTDLVLRPAN